MIESYSFGRIVVDGQSYTSDLIVLPDRVVDHWRRKSGHRLVPEDLESLLGDRAGTLVVGTGNSGLMHVPAETLDYLDSLGFAVFVQRTSEACETYNRLVEHGLVIAALHLTCWPLGATDGSWSPCPASSLPLTSPWAYTIMIVGQERLGCALGPSLGPP